MGLWVAGLPTQGFLSFLGLDFNIQLSDGEVEESASEAEVDARAEVLSGAPNRAPLPDDLRVPLEANSFTSPTGAPSFGPLLP